MRIALITPGGVDRGGERRIIACLLALVERLARDHDVQIFALKQEAESGQWPLRGAKVHNAGGRVPAWRSLRQLMCEHARSPFDVFHAFWASPAGVIAAAAGWRLGVPVLLHFAGGDLTDLPDIQYGGRHTAWGRATLRLALAGADHVIAPSTFVVEQARMLGISAERVPFGVDLARWPPLAPHRRAAKARLLHVGHLNRVKDHDMLLNVAARLARAGIDFTLNMVGLDMLAGAVQRRAAELGLTDRVHFAGLLSHSQTRRYFEEGDILLVTSRHEAGPMVALEAAVAGVPTIGTHVGLLAEWAPDAALTVAPRDDAAMAKLVMGLLSDEGRRLELATRAQARALAEDADVTARRVAEKYNALCRR